MNQKPYAAKLTENNTSGNARKLAGWFFLNPTLTFLMIDINSDYADAAPIPAAEQNALWKYKAVCLQANQRVDQWSDVVCIPVAG